ncbi:MAG: hypothetical protein CMO80_10595 [Verrucomicrobiales bacterium]|nr:hypothetical protein [Verrucomicrobiales bacterium]|tara:strand:- start:138 stop:479 length:342 start_codon:yes stop_codon:yes gene_type:complete
MKDPFLYLAIGVALVACLFAQLGIVFSWLTGANSCAFAAYGTDKFLAKKKKRRISEVDLFFYTLTGGTIGAICGMKLFRHKTRKSSFKKSIVAIVVIQLALIGGYVWLRFANR